MLRRPLVASLLLLLGILGLSAAVYAQLDSGDRGILPLESTGTLEVDGIHVDVGAQDSMSARFAGWRMAQRQGFRMLWAKTNNAPIAQAPNLPDATLDQIVSAISVQHELIGPNRYIADLGVQFDSVRAAPFLGSNGEAPQVQHSLPMLLIPVLVTSGTETSVELRNAWQRAWAQFRTGQSPITYVRVSGMGSDPLLINAAETRRPGRGWWRALLNLYGAQDILVAEVQLHRAFPGGPAIGRFIARHGPDDQVIGGFTLTAPSSEAIPAMMAQGAQRIDQLFANALASDRLNRDPSLNLPPPPVIPVVATPPPPKPVNVTNAFQVQVTGTNVNIYNFAMAHLHTLPGITSATPQQINPGGTSYILVNYRGDISQLAAALTARGWIVDYSGTVIRIRSSSDKPPALPPPPVVPAPTPQPQPVQQPPAATTPGTQQE